MCTASESTSKRILVVGNGFDLAHNLPTRYQDMLQALSQASEDIKNSKSSWLTPQKAERYLSNPFIKYFMTRNELIGWTDFESEIRTIVNYFKTPYKSSERSSKTVNQLIETFFKPIYDLWKNKQYNQLWEKLKDYLNQLIDYIDIYLAEYLPIISPKTLEKCKTYPHFIYHRKYDFLLSFNYTATYMFFSSVTPGLGHNIPTEYQFIHGEISFTDESKKLPSNSHNIVLGIEDDEPSDLDTVYFKKYFQRIQKRTGRELYGWLDRHSDSDNITVDIFGHSLDTTDKDILLTLFERTHHTNIYYYNQADYERKTLNLIRLYGADEFTKRYYNYKIRLCKISTEDERYIENDNL